MSSKKYLKALGEREKLRMFLSGHVCAYEGTAVKGVKHFGEQFCRVITIPWRNITYLYSVYTRDTTAFVGDITICKKNWN